MDSSYILGMYTPILKTDFYLGFFGNFTDSTTDEIISLIENKLVKLNLNQKKTVRKASFLVAESFQNVIRHGVKNYAVKANQIAVKPGFQVKITAGCFQIFGSNGILRSDQEKIKNILERVNSLTKEELKELWRSEISNGEYTKNGGGGLGLIEMARKTDYPLEFQFEDFDHSQQIFHNLLSFGLEGSSPENKLDFDVFRKLYDDQLKNNALLAFKGLFNLDICHSLESLMVGHYENNSSNVSTWICLQVISLFKQAIEKFGDNVRGYIGMGESEHSDFIMCGFFIENEQIGLTEGEEDLEALNLWSDQDIKAIKSVTKFIDIAINKTDFGNMLEMQCVYVKEPVDD